MFINRMLTRRLNIANIKDVLVENAHTHTHTKRENIPYKTHMQCEECVVMNDGKDMHFCNVTKNGHVQDCHLNYHQIKYPSLIQILRE